MSLPIFRIRAKNPCAVSSSLQSEHINATYLPIKDFVVRTMSILVAQVVQHLAIEQSRFMVLSRGSLSCVSVCTYVEFLTAGIDHHDDGHM